MMRSWIETRLKEVGKKKGELGAALGLPPSRISELLNGKRRIQSHEIPMLSDFLDIEVASILAHIQTGTDLKVNDTIVRTEQITVMGNLEIPDSDFHIWPSTEHYTISLPIQANFSGITKFALTNAASSADLTDLYICIAEHDFNESDHRNLQKLTKIESTNEPAGKISNRKAPRNRQNKKNINIALVIARYQQL